MKGWKKQRFKRLYICLAGVLVITLFLTYQFREKILDSAVKLAKNIANETVYQTVLSILEEEEIAYKDLISIDDGADKSIASLSANATAVNELKAKTVLKIRQAFESETVQMLAVPFGTLSGISVLSGQGPMIPCRVLMSSVPQVSLQHQFDGAGINQTLHRLTMTVQVPLSVTMPLQDRDTEVSCTFLIGETILIGKVPDSYTNVISDPEVADDIFNYGELG